MEDEGRRKRGRPNRRWFDRVIDDIDQREGTVGEEVHDRDTWNIDPT